MKHRPAFYLSNAYYDALLAEARDEHVAMTTEAICDTWLPTMPGTTWRGGRGLAILQDPADLFSPGDGRSNRHMVRLARQHGLKAEIINPSMFSELHEFDGLWVRSHTSPTGMAYSFVRRAEQLDMPVLDDSQSIRHCCNKVFLAERMKSRGVAVPRTIVIRTGTNLAEVESDLPYPIVLKSPDGSFSTAVFKVECRSELVRIASDMLKRSHFIIAQAFIRTSFDWRIAFLDGDILFACKYRMAPGHWQIVKYEDGKEPLEGDFAAVPIAELPKTVSDAARAAAGAMGRGLYGVDLKQTPDEVLVIEVNDNPNMMHGVEDHAEGDAPWLKILSWFSARFMVHRARLTAEPRSGARLPMICHAAAPLVKERRAS